MQFFKNHSKMVLVSTILVSLYAIFLMVYFYGGVANSNSDAEVVGGVLATALVTPHMILIVLGVVFSIVALFANKNLGSNHVMCSCICFNIINAFIFYVHNSVRNYWNYCHCVFTKIE